MNEPYTFPAIMAGLALVFIVIVLVGYVLPLFFRHIKSERTYPMADKHPKSEIKKPENKTLDFLLMPDEMPNLEDRIVFDEHEKAISN